MTNRMMPRYHLRFTQDLVWIGASDDLEELKRRAERSDFCVHIVDAVGNAETRGIVWQNCTTERYGMTGTVYRPSSPSLNWVLSDTVGQYGRGRRMD